MFYSYFVYVYFYTFLSLQCPMNTTDGTLVFYPPSCFEPNSDQTGTNADDLQCTDVMTVNGPYSEVRKAKEHFTFSLFSLK